MFDAMLCRWRFRTFNVTDDFNRKALHIEVHTSITSVRLVRIFGQLKNDHGYLAQVLHTDNRPKLLSEAFVKRSKTNGMAIQYIQPGKPNQNAHLERFNLAFRDELLDPYCFARLDGVREAAWQWMIDRVQRATPA